MSNEETFVCLQDIHAVDVGLAFELGLLYSKGTVLSGLLPTVEVHLLKSKKIQLVSKAAPSNNKRGAGPSENK